MLQEAIIKGEAAYLKSLTRRKDVTIDEIVAAKESLNNKVRGMKLDRAVEMSADPDGKYRIQLQSPSEAVLFCAQKQTTSG